MKTLEISGPCNRVLLAARSRFDSAEPAGKTFDFVVEAAIHRAARQILSRTLTLVSELPEYAQVPPTLSFARLQTLTCASSLGSHTKLTTLNYL